MSNPNPQNLTCAAFEAPAIRMTMDPATDITGWSLKLNVRNKDGDSLIASITFTVESAGLGIASFPLSSSDTGTTLGIADFDYDIWRIDAGFEKRLVYGELSVGTEQWQ